MTGVHAEAERDSNGATERYLHHPNPIQISHKSEDTVPTSKTVMGKSFEYSGTLATGITVFFKPPYKKKITSDIVRVIRAEITKRSPVLMGANRAPLVPNSVGETLAERYNEPPQVMSYVLPLLVEEGFCTVSDRKPYMIRVQNSGEI
jgi:hypothetical protein